MVGPILTALSSFSNLEYQISPPQGVSGHYPTTEILFLVLITHHCFVKEESIIIVQLYTIISHSPSHLSSSGTVPSKLMCFTRSTPNIHRLPAVYPTQLSATDHGLSHEALMKDMINDEVCWKVRDAV